MVQRDKNEETNREHKAPVRGRPRVETPKASATTINSVILLCTTVVRTYLPGTW